VWHLPSAGRDLNPMDELSLGLPHSVSDERLKTPAEAKTRVEGNFSIPHSSDHLVAVVDCSDIRFIRPYK
jgi:hypothetical protein